MKKILLVDDQPHIIRLMRLSLERNGYKTDIAFNGKDAFMKLKASYYDVLITDVEMPHMDGRQLCDALRLELPAPRPYIFVITAKTELDLRDWIEKIEDAELLEKPVSLKNLLVKLEAYFSGIEHKREAAS